jgi:two-component system CheB/CheR fusion protein
VLLPEGPRYSPLLARYFTKKENGFQINENIRHTIIFAKHNVIDEPPFSKLDLISCRNLLIYLNLDVQLKLLTTFHMCLRNDSYLFLGSSESLGKLSDGFDIINSKAKIFRKRNRFKPELAGEASSTMTHSRSSMLQSRSSADAVSAMTHQLSGVFESIACLYVPASVIVDNMCNIIYSMNDIRKYVHLPSGQMTTNLLKMLDKEISVIVSSLVRRADKTSGEVYFDNLKNSDGELFSIKCKRFLVEDSDIAYYLISFVQKEKNSDKDDKESSNIVSVSISEQYRERIEELEREVQQKNESLQATVEELETSNEELQSSNEELIASNEELQSTNEELQSVNEELYTVNSEHISKIEELTQLNSDYDNTLRNTSIGTLFLDRSKVIRKVSKIASSITNILPTDIGRPIHHLALESLYKGFKQDIDTVNSTLQMIEREIYSEGKWYLMRMLPNRTVENAVNGIIVTFVEITRLKKSQEEVTMLTSRLKEALAVGKMFWWEWNVDDDSVVIDDDALTEIFGYNKDLNHGEMAFWIGITHPDDKNSRNENLNKLLRGEEKQIKMKFRIRKQNGEYIRLTDHSGKIERDGKQFLTGIARID